VNVTATDKNALAERFEEHRSHLRAVAYRMLGSLSEADDAVQGAWLRLSRADAWRIDNLGGWLTTAVARESLDMLRSRQARREVSLDPWWPEPIVSDYASANPEDAALLADSVGLALLIVLETLTPEARLAFVLHDVFAVPFNEIAPLVGRSPSAARQLASRARRQAQRAPTPDPDLDRQRTVVDAFLAATRQGNFEALLTVLDPDVVLRVDREFAVGAPTEVHGAVAVAERALDFTGVAESTRPAKVNGAAGFIVAPRGQLLAVIGCVVRQGRIVEMDVITDPARLRELASSIPGQ
jgi:RNA polymerase sigma-70 factor (ECF subfamily)